MARTTRTTPLNTNVAQDGLCQCGGLSGCL